MDDTSLANCNPASPHWRNNHHQFADLPSNIQGYIREKFCIPAVHSAILLPDPRSSVLDLISTPLPPITLSDTSYPIPDGHIFFTPKTATPDTELLTRTLVPPRKLIIQLLTDAKQQWLDGAESIQLPGEDILLPLWSIQFWSELHLIIEPARKVWQDGISWLLRQELAPYGLEVRDTLDALSTLSWSGNIPSACADKTSFLKSTLAHFLSHNWLGDEQINQMLYILQKELREMYPSRDIHILDTIFTRELVRVYKDDQSGKSLYNPAGVTFIHRFGQNLTKTSEFGGIFNLFSRHWISAAVDMARDALAYGDPTGDSPDIDVVDTLAWFVSQHLSIPEDHLERETLPCPKQNLLEDSWNCGIFTFSGLSTFFIPKSPLIPTSNDQTDLERMRML